MQGKYDIYLNAINNTDFGKISALIASIDSSEASIINSLEVNAEWESPVKDALVIKINEFNSKFRGFLTEKENLGYIISISNELKQYIDKYNIAVGQLGTLNSSMSSKKSELNSFKSSITIPIPENDYANLTKYHNYISLIDGIHSNILNKNSEISILVQNADMCISKLKSIQFGSSAGVRFASTLGNIYGGRGGKLDEPTPISATEVVPQTSNETSASPNSIDAYTLSAATLLSTPLSGYNDLFIANYEDPILKNIDAINFNSIPLREQQHLASIVLSNMPGTTDPKQLVALDLAKEAHKKLSVQIEQNDKARIQQEKLFQKYQESNHNEDIFTKNGEIRAIKIELEKATNPAKIEELNSKLTTAVEKFNSENVSGTIPMNTVLDPVLTDAYSKTNPLVSANIPSEVKETAALSLFTESLYNSPRPEAPMTPINDSSGNVVGYQITDNRYSSGQQIYTLNMIPGGYTLNVGDQTYTYTKENKNN